jgi:hypothetical protein
VAALKVDPDARLTEVASKQPGFRWPIPIDARLDALVGVANGAGAATTRKELLAALVLTAPTGAEMLRNAVVTFRIATVRQAAVGSDVGGVGEYQLGKRGRPRGKRS